MTQVTGVARISVKELTRGEQALRYLNEVPKTWTGKAPTA